MNEVRLIQTTADAFWSVFRNQEADPVAFLNTPAVLGELTPVDCDGVSWDMGIHGSAGKGSVVVVAHIAFPVDGQNGRVDFAFVQPVDHITRPDTSAYMAWWIDQALAGKNSNVLMGRDLTGAPVEVELRREEAGHLSKALVQMVSKLQDVEAQNARARATVPNLIAGRDILKSLRDQRGGEKAAEFDMLDGLLVLLLKTVS